MIETRIVPMGPVAPTKENEMYTNRKHPPEQYYLEMRELHDETDTDWESLERIGEDTYEGWVLNNLIYTSEDEELIEALNAYHDRRSQDTAYMKANYKDWYIDAVTKADGRGSE